MLRSAVRIASTCLVMATCAGLPCLWAQERAKPAKTAPKAETGLVVEKRRIPAHQDWVWTVAPVSRRQEADHRIGGEGAYGQGVGLRDGARAAQA